MEEKKTRLTCSITEVKQSPMAIFDLAKQQEAGVYVYNRNRAVGVMITVEEYQTLKQSTNHLSHASNEQQQIDHMIRQAIPFGTVFSARTLDERFVELGFDSRLNSETLYAEMIHELKESGKIDYVSQKLVPGSTILAEVIGEQSSHSNLPDKILVKKIYLSRQ